jgi:hypothetical protein
MNYIYNQILKIFTTEEENLNKLLKNFFLEYDDIIGEYKIIFKINIQKINSVYVDSLNEESFCHSKILLNSKQTIKKNNYKYKFLFNNVNYKQENKMFVVNIFIPYSLSSDLMIYQKYNYYICLIENKKTNIIKKVNYNNKNTEEITLKSVITEIIDNIIQL